MKPLWLKAEIASGPGFGKVRACIQSAELHTVCQEAKCPNLAECWNSGTATFMVLGKVCTRNCGFCAVQSSKKGERLNPKEPESISEAVKEFGLKHAVLTSVGRDDLLDFGAGHFAECIRAAKRAGATVEALIPDFQGNAKCLETVVKAGPEVIGHNIEVVERLQPFARDSRAGYRQSLSVLSNVKLLDSGIFTKSGLMLGLGETRKEIEAAMDDLLASGVDFLTLGQYLQPGKKKLPVQKFVEPKEFAGLGETALGKGFRQVESGPLVRSSYRAGEMLERQLGA